jgi:hypothetical protein
MSDVNTTTPAHLDGVGPSPQDLAGLQQELYNELLDNLLDDGEANDNSLKGMFAGLKLTLEEIRDDFEESLPGSDFLSGSGGAGAGLGVAGGSFPSKPISVAQTLHPTAMDLAKLPVEFSMGYLLIYDQLVKMSNDDDKKKKEAKGSSTSIGGFFSNLLKGAEGLALIAIGLIAFAGAMLLFPLIQWEPALKGLVAFSIFVVGMVLISKTLGDNMKDFRTFAEGILLMTAGIILFNVAIWVSAQIHPFWPAAWQTLIAYGIFVAGMVVVAYLLNKELGSFVKFALGVLILVGALMLFDLAIVITAKTLPFILPALVGVGFFLGFILGAVLIANIVSFAIPLFVAFGAGVLILTGALLLFGYTISYFSTLGPKIAPAITAAKDSFGFITAIGDFVGSGLKVIVQVALFGAALIILSAALLLWAAAIAIMGLVQGVIPRAQNGIEQSLILLGTIRDMAVKSVGAFAAIIVFSVGLAVISVTFLAWGAALAVMGAVSGYVTPAEAGLNASMDIIKSIASMALAAIIAFVPALVFAVGLIALSAAFVAWGIALQVLGRVSQYVPNALEGIEVSMLVLTAIGSLGVMALLIMPGVLAFSANLIIVSAAFIAWGAAMAIISNLSDKKDSAITTILSILDTFKLISDSVRSGTLKDVSTFTSGLADISKGIYSLVNKSQGVSLLVESFAKLSSMNLSSVFKPLIDLTEKQPEIDKLAKSLEKISKAMKPPAKTIWDTLGNLTGGNVANPNADPFGSGSAKKDSQTGPSVIEKILTDIRDRLEDWDKLIFAIAKNTEDSSVAVTSVLVNSSGNSSNSGGVKSAIQAVR